MKRMRIKMGIVLLLFLFAYGCGKDENIWKEKAERVSEHQSRDTSLYANSETVENIPNTDAASFGTDANIANTDNIDNTDNTETTIHGQSTGGGVKADTYFNSDEESEDTLTLIMVGDMLMHTPVNESGVREDGSVDFSHLFTHTKDRIQEADLAIVNQEVILGGKELGISGYPAFNTYQELGDDLAEAGFDVVLHATNHALDKGKKGILQCLSYWEDAHPEIAVLGIQNTEDAQDEIYIYEKNGIRVAILNYTYGTNGISLPSDMPFAVNLMDKKKMAEDIEKAKESADFVVVCPHWGTEYVLEETDYQKEYAQFMLDCGVDLVLGTHPHVIEPVRMLENENGEQMLVYYSLGNYVNCTSSETEDIGARMLGAMAEITIAKDKNNDVFIKEYGAHPLVTYVSENQEEITVYPLEEFTDEMAKESYTVKFDTDFDKTYCENLWENVMESEK